MPFDVFTMAAIRDELAASCIGARVDRVIQPADLSIAFKLWGRSGSRFLVLSADPPHPSVYATGARLAKAFETPSPFLMLMRKYCTSGRIESVEAVHLERVLCLTLSTAEHGQVQVIAEIMGNRSNIVLTDARREILGAIKLVGPHQSRTRRILPHVSYMLPSRPAVSPRFGSGERVDPSGSDPQTWARLTLLLGSVPAMAQVGQVLVGLLDGCSPSVARDVSLRAGIEPGDDLAPVGGRETGRIHEPDRRRRGGAKALQ